MAIRATQGQILPEPAFLPYFETVSKFTDYNLNKINKHPTTTF